MEHSKTPLPEEMTHIESDDSLDDPDNLDNLDNSNNDDQENQQVDLDNPMLHVIDEDNFEDDAGFKNSQVGSDATQGLTPIHYQNIDESRIDELLVEDNLDDNNYPDIVDIADRDAAKLSHDNDF